MCIVKIGNILLLGSSLGHPSTARISILIVLRNSVLNKSELTLFILEFSKSYPPQNTYEHPVQENIWMEEKHRHGR